MSRLKIAPPPPPPAVEEIPAPVEEQIETSPSPAPVVAKVDARPSRLAAAPPKLREAPANLHLPSDGFVDLNFKVEPELRQRFKMEAVRRGMSNKDFLAACFQVYLETFPSSEGFLELKGPTPEQRRKRIEARKERVARMEKLRSRQG